MALARVVSFDGRQKPARIPRTRPILRTLVSLALFGSLFASVVIADEDDDDDGESNWNEEDGERGPRRAGRFTDDEGSYSGRYVSFEFQRDSCRIEVFNVSGIVFFDEVQLPGECRDPRSEGSGAVIRLRSSAASLFVHDAPNGLLRFEATEGTITFTWPAAVAASNVDNRIELDAGNLSGTLRLDEGEHADSEGRSSWVHDAQGSFWVHPREGGSQARTEIREQIRNGIIAGEIDVLVDDDRVTSQVLAYDAVDIRTASRGDGHFRFIVDANLTEGRVFVVNLGPGVFGAADLGIHYWDVENASEKESDIAVADDLDDVLAIAPSEGAEYWIVDDVAGKHVLVAVPHFSVHIFDVLTFAGDERPLVWWGAMLGVGFVLLGIVGIVPRRPRYP